jgi:hypothetical protein
MLASIILTLGESCLFSHTIVNVYISIKFK